MSFENTFCSSPWFHMEINNVGIYRYCRWADDSAIAPPYFSIRDTSPDDFFQHKLVALRKQLLAGGTIAGCQQCHEMERHHKVSGRQKQLLKIGVSVDNFSKTMLSSPWVSKLTDAEIRKGSYAGKFYDLILELKDNKDFKLICPISKEKEKRGEYDDMFESV